MRRKKFGCAAIILFLLFVCVSCQSDSGQTINLQAESDALQESVRVILLSHAEVESSTTHAMAVRFKERVEKLSGGNIYVDIFPDNSLGYYDACSTALRKNTLQMRIGPCESEIFTILAYPDLSGWSLEELSEALQDGPLREAVEEEQLSVGIRYLGCLPLAPAVLISKKKIENLNDLKDLRVRIMGTEMMSAFWRAVDAEPAIYSADEVYSVLQQNLADANAQNGINVIISRKLYESQKYVLNLNHMIYIEPVYISDIFFQSLSSEEQQWVTDALEETLKEEEELARQREEDNVDFLESQGIEFLDPSEELQNQIHERVEGALRQKAEDMFGKEHFEQLMEQVAAE
ncbi:MAG: TRAP transporter substrate-binding protein [Clostridiales bacterium]|nr:TRAP transporter substrate-binding protein [Clostridiales bacterium]